MGSSKIPFSVSWGTATYNRCRWTIYSNKPIMSTPNTTYPMSAKKLRNSAKKLDIYGNLSYLNDSFFLSSLDPKRLSRIFCFDGEELRRLSRSPIHLRGCLKSPQKTGLSAGIPPTPLFEREIEGDFSEFQPFQTRSSGALTTESRDTRRKDRIPHGRKIETIQRASLCPG